MRLVKSKRRVRMYKRSVVENRREGHKKRKTEVEQEQRGEHHGRPSPTECEGEDETVTKSPRRDEAGSRMAVQASVFGAESSSAVVVPLAPLASAGSATSALASSAAAPSPLGTGVGSDFDGGTAEVGAGVPSLLPS